MPGGSLLRRLAFAAALVSSAAAGPNTAVAPSSVSSSLRQEGETSTWVSTIVGDQHQSTSAQTLSSRRLDTSETDTVLDKMMVQASQTGNRVRKAIKWLRGGSDEFYQQLITAVKINICESNEEKTTRFVPADDSKAYKYSNGSCVTLINAKDHATVDAYYQQKCEVKPNCHWADFDPQMDTNRLTTFDKNKTMTPDEATAKVKAYANSVMVFAVPGIVLSVLSMLTMFFFLLCRCCCNKCGGRAPRASGYSRSEIFMPVFFFLAFGAGICVCAAFSFFHREIALDGISATFNGVDNTLQNASEWTYTISAPLEHIRDTVLDATANISSALSGLGGIGDDLDTFVGLLDKIADDISVNALPEGCDADKDVICIPCVVCGLIGSEVTASTMQIKTNAEPAVNEVEIMHGQIEVLLVDIAGEVRDELNEQVDMISGIRATITKVQDQMGNVEEYFSTYRPIIASAIRIIFAFGAAFVAGVGFIGVLFGLSPFKALATIIHIAYFLGFLALFMSFLISAVALGVSILMGDTCEVVDMFSRNWTVPLGDDTGRIANACFRNESLIGVLGLEDKLAFARGGIAFPDIDITEVTDFSQLTNLSDTVLNTTAEDVFPVSGMLNDSIDLLNTLTGQTAGSCTPGGGHYVADATILTPWNVTSDPPASSGFSFMVQRYHAYDDDCGSSNPIAVPFSCYGDTCPFSLRVGQEYLESSSLYTVKVTSESFVEKLRADVFALVTFSVSFAAKITDMVAAVLAVKAQLEASLIKDVDEFEDVMYCTFAADGYAEIFDALCGDVVPSLTMLSLLLYLAGFFLIPVNVCLIILAKRLRVRRHRRLVVEDDIKGSKPPETEQSATETI
jgi:hypothetical protein